MQNLNINEEEALQFLEAQDKLYGVNNITPIDPPANPVEEVRVKPIISQESAAGESSWKILSLAHLPSEGKYYPDNTEILIRPAKSKEIRHWSTIDESDPIEVIDKINFILGACTKFTVRGHGALTYNDYLEIDRYHILFRIYELTFPNQENKLFANIKCQYDGHINSTQIQSDNLKGFSLPDELLKWYSAEDKCFKIVSEKLNETFYLYLPTIGVDSAFSAKRKHDIANGNDIDKSFYEFGPYLVPEWRGLTLKDLTDLKFETFSWPDNKFIFIHRFTELLRKASLNQAVSHCAQCKRPTESHIFLEGSFTVKDIFIISTRLDELI
jgi:hypothetical protein